MAKMHTLVDGFSSFNTANPPWQFSYGTPTLTSGRIHLSCISSYEGLFSGTTYDMTDSYLFAELTSIPTGGNNTRNTSLQVQVDASNWIEVAYVGTEMQFRTNVANTITVWEAVAYNSTNHKWWRLNHTTGTGFTCEFSADGQTWTQLGSAHTTSLTLTAMFAHITCGYYGSETSPPDAQVDNVNNSTILKPAAGTVTVSAVANQTSTNNLRANNGAPTQPLIGYFAGYGESLGIPGVYANEKRLSRPMQVATDYLPHDSWSWFNATTMRKDQLDPWRKWRDTRPGSKLVYGLPLLTDDNVGDFSGVVAGTYDSYFTTAGNALIDSGHSDAIIMLGWEPNNNTIGSWQATGNPTGYISAFQHVVTLLRGLTGDNFQFLLESALGFQSGSIDAFDDYYPGNSYVDYIGLNIYDFKVGDPTISAADRWTYLKTRAGGINDHISFVASKSKQNVCAEWGLYAANGTPDLDGGGDNAYFVARMFEYFRDNSLYYQSYFGYNWGGGVLSDYPNGETEYKQRFSINPFGMTAINAPSSRIGAKAGGIG